MSVDIVDVSTIVDVLTMMFEQCQQTYARHMSVDIVDVLTIVNVLTMMSEQCQQTYARPPAQAPALCFPSRCPAALPPKQPARRARARE